MLFEHRRKLCQRLTLGSQDCLSTAFIKALPVNFLFCSISNQQQPLDREMSSRQNLATNESG